MVLPAFFNLCHLVSGVSIKIGVARVGLNGLTDCINKRPLVPLSRGEGGRRLSVRVLLQKILNLQSPKMLFSASWGLNLRQKSVFFIEENLAFNLSVTQSIPASNVQMMKTKLSTFARKRILRKPKK